VNGFAKTTRQGDLGMVKNAIPTDAALRED
jgi:hypothetical protein